MTDDTHRWHLDLDHVLELARLELDPRQRERVERDLQRILLFAAEMDEADLPSPESGPPGRGRWREDEVDEPPAQRWQDNAPQLTGGWFVVPDSPDRS